MLANLLMQGEMLNYFCLALLGFFNHTGVILIQN